MAEYNLTKVLRGDQHFGCGKQRQRNMGLDLARRLYRALNGERMKAKDFEKGGEPVAVQVLDHDLNMLKAYCGLRGFAQLTRTDTADLTDKEVASLAGRTDDFVAFGGFVGSTGILEEAETLLELTRPGPTWGATNRKEKSAAAVASVPEQYMSANAKMKWMLKLAAAAEGDKWLLMKKIFDSEVKRVKQEGADATDEEEDDRKPAAVEAPQGQAPQGFRLSSPGTWFARGGTAAAAVADPAVAEAVSPGDGQAPVGGNVAPRAAAKRSLNLEVVHEFKAGKRRRAATYRARQEEDSSSESDSDFAVWSEE